MRIDNLDAFIADVEGGCSVSREEGLELAKRLKTATAEPLSELRHLWAEHDRLTRIEFGDPEGLSYSEGLRLQQVRKDIGLATTMSQFDAMAGVVEEMKAKVKTVEAETERAKDKWREYERDYILPTFRWAAEEGIDLHELVRKQPGRNCVELLVMALRTRILDAITDKVRERRENGEDREKVRSLERQLSLVKTNRENVWMWQEDGNELHSLSCPVVMEADTLRSAIEAAVLEGMHHARDAVLEGIQRAATRIGV